ncbi:MAG: D-amino-acid transaminase [Rhodospirillales bacterium]|nr:D-amino-acid transaminase [Rhodospirillales bacterium]
MSRIAYVNGRYVPHREAAVHIEDRGYQFADGVYEVTAVKDGKLIDEDRHLQRLARSLRELRIERPMSDAALKLVTRELLRRNGVRDGIVYLQVTRGVARRDHAFPVGARPSIVMTAKRTKGPPPKAVEEGVSVITIPDQRWARCDIKSVSLLPNVLGKQRAKEAGAFEAWQVDRAGNVTEGTSTNAWIVTEKGEVVTRKADEAILNGITRLAVLDIIRSEGLAFIERPFSVEEAKSAREAFLTSTTSLVLPVVSIDGTPIGDGKPGPFTRRLREYYQKHMT